MDTEKERLKIREELSTMSFESIIKLKEELGRKVYNEKILNIKSRKKPIANFKKANKNSPCEMKIFKYPINANQQQHRVKNPLIRDPRFDPLCGEFNSKKFRTNFKFLNDLRSEEYKKLQKQLEETNDEESIKKIKFLLQRMENQERERQHLDEEEERKQKERLEQIEALKQGRKPHFKKKSEKKLEKVVNQYQDLKQKGKLKKYIQKKRKFNSSKNIKKFSSNMM